MMLEPRAAWPSRAENRGVARFDRALGPHDVALTFVNHATFVVQFAGVNVLTDPVWSKRASPVSWAGPARVRDPGVALSALPRVDVVLLSHNHYDHLDAETLRALSSMFPKCRALVAWGNKSLVERLGFRDVHELDWWQSVRIGDDLVVTFAPTQHFSGRGLFDRNRSLWGAFMLQSGSRRVYFGGDGGYCAHFAETTRRLGAPDVAMLGIGAYRPEWFMRPIHMTPADALMAHRDLRAKQSVAMHFGTFQLSAEGIDQPWEELKAAMVAAAGGAGVSEDDAAFVRVDEGETRVWPWPGGSAT